MNTTPLAVIGRYKRGDLESSKLKTFEVAKF